MLAGKVQGVVVQIGTATGSAESTPKALATTAGSTAT